ncbi:hypothetical protein FGU65_06970 [Methanoculleus sp. FWC-SCC1]|uniref:Uncharacterized protein n=1 Tax=Methanoculleus frigidifontis TaxID=2584085 RepID=A0ABT8M9Q8_9EURY|nr:hypothetical protein [Methanoculleus sp. FWC-SCC1]MDN7024631.1 hypothetical protein [Methanoculleus sp. FWC-SCC1]
MGALRSLSCFACILVMLTAGWAPASALDPAAPPAENVTGTADILLDAFADLLPAFTDDLPDFIDRTAAIAENPGDMDAAMEEYREMGGSIRSIYQIFDAVHDTVVRFSPGVLPPDIIEQFARSEERFGDLDLQLDGILDG